MYFYFIVLLYPNGIQVRNKYNRDLVLYTLKQFHIFFISRERKREREKTKRKVNGRFFCGIQVAAVVFIRIQTIYIIMAGNLVAKSPKPIEFRG